MANFEKQEGVAFLLIYYSERNELYYMRFQELYRFWKRAADGGRKSIRYEELDPRFFLSLRQGYHVPYLDGMNLDLAERDGELDKA